MRFMYFLPVLGLAAVPAAGMAQIPRAIAPLPPAGANVYFASTEPRATIGVSTVSGSSSRDTLGVLVSIVRSGSPAEKAGLQEGDRIASVNTVNLRLAHSDIGDAEMAAAMNNRLQRALSHVKPGDAVQLRVYSAGDWKTVTVRAEAPPDSRSGTMRPSQPRASIGVSLGSFDNARDSLGVLIMSVDDSGPAARAGLQEGNRIQSVNGVDLRRMPSKDDEADDEIFSSGAPARRLQRELAKLKPGDVAKLRVYADGSVRNVDVKTVDAADLHYGDRTIVVRRSTSPTSFNFDVGRPSPSVRRMEVPTPSVDVERDGNIVINMRRTLDGLRASTAPLLETLGSRMQTLGLSLERRRLDW